MSQPSSPNTPVQMKKHERRRRELIVDRQMGKDEKASKSSSGKVLMGRGPVIPWCRNARGKWGYSNMMELVGAWEEQGDNSKGGPECDRKMGTRDCSIL